MIQDIHSHTYYSFCGKDRPEAIVEAAIAGGIELFGICDHNYSIAFGSKAAYKAPEEVVPNDYGRRLEIYHDHMSLIREKYSDRIRMILGVEISTTAAKPRVFPPASTDFSMFDYALVESLDKGDDSFLRGDIFSYAEHLGLPAVGLAHTDLLGWLRRSGQDPYRYLCRMAEAGIFWEMNMTYDSIHRYIEHEYMLRFFQSEEEQAMVRESGMRLSVGFDGHRVEDYRPDRVRDACRRISEMGIKLAFED